jgi:hypothetical protein
MTKSEFYIPQYFHVKGDSMVWGEKGISRQRDLNPDSTSPPFCVSLSKLLNLLEYQFQYYKWDNNVPRKRVSKLDNYWYDWYEMPSTAWPKVDS